MVTVFFFFNDTATTEIYTLSLHDALPICERFLAESLEDGMTAREWYELLNCKTFFWVSKERLEGLLGARAYRNRAHDVRSEEHTSELQSRQYLVCRLLLEKKKKTGRDCVM